MWHGGSAVSARAAGFQAERMILRDLGSSFYGFDQGCDLLKALTFVGVVHGTLFFCKLPPLVAVDWIQIPFFSLGKTNLVKEL